MNWEKKRPTSCCDPGRRERDTNRSEVKEVKFEKKFYIMGEE